MELDELKDFLRRYAPDLASKLFEKSERGLYYLNSMYFHELPDWIKADKQGLVQPSAAFGVPRQIMLASSLRELGISACAGKGLLDILIEKIHNAEVRGSFTSSSKYFKEGYNNPNSGKLQLSFGKQLHFLVMHVLDTNSIKFTSMRLLIVYVDTSMFEHVSSPRQNRSILHINKLIANHPECIIGDQEIFNERCGQTYIEFG